MNARQLLKSISGASLAALMALSMPAIAGSDSHGSRAAKKTQRVASDSWITTKVKSSLLADSVTKGFEISVKTYHHVVTLTGTVDTQESADHAADLARQIKGVKRVDTSTLKTGRS